MKAYAIRYDTLQEKLAERGFTLTERKFALIVRETDGDLEYEFFTLKEINAFLLGIAYRHK